MIDSMNAELSELGYRMLLLPEETQQEPALMLSPERPPWAPVDNITADEEWFYYDFPRMGLFEADNVFYGYFNIAKTQLNLDEREHSIWIYGEFEPAIAAELQAMTFDNAEKAVQMFLSVLADKNIVIAVSIDLQIVTQHDAVLEKIADPVEQVTE